MKIKINLLPEKRLKRTRQKEIARFVIWQEVMIICITLLFFSAISGVALTVQAKLTDVENRLKIKDTQTEYQEIKQYEKVFKEIAKQNNFIYKIQQNDFKWSSVFKNINSSIGKDVVVKSIKNEENIITLTGIADSRDDLIWTKMLFEENDCFTDVNVPLNDMVLKKDIKFEISFKANKQCLLIKK